ncbi:MAG: 4Fe-4S dicluster domain-containing protein [Chloroflexota bacterium]|nr:MAG: 4Fe-4S dicluster domain-containing protein [Chloroflexota bacterium]
MWTRAFGSFFATSGVKFQSELCLRGRSPRLLCSRCADECPPGALDLAGRLPNLQLSRCTECGVCGAVCPVEAFTLLPSPVDLFANTRERGAVRLACGKLPGSGETVRVPCHGYLDVTLLTTLGIAAPRGLWLDTSGCLSCEGRRGFSAAKRSFDAASRLLTVLGLQAEIAFQPDRPQWLGQTNTDVSRRDLLRRLAGKATTAAASLVVDLDRQTEGGQSGLPSKQLPLRRRLLLHILRSGSNQTPEMLAAEGAPWAEPRIGSDCSACLLCVTFCPTAALTAYEDPDHLEITLDSSRCVACDVCAQICPAGAITFVSQLSVADFVSAHPHLIIDFPKIACPSCGQLFISLPQAKLCPRCQKDAELEQDVSSWT